VRKPPCFCPLLEVRFFLQKPPCFCVFFMVFWKGGFRSGGGLVEELLGISWLNFLDCKDWGAQSLQSGLVADLGVSAFWSAWMFAFGCLSLGCCDSASGSGLWNLESVGRKEQQRTTKGTPKEYQRKTKGTPNKQTTKLPLPGWQPGFCSQIPKTTLPGFATRKQKPKEKNRRPRTKGQGSKAKGQGPKAKDKGPKT
jgi:hypothetical protein